MPHGLRQTAAGIRISKKLESLRGLFGESLNLELSNACEDYRMVEIEKLIAFAIPLNMVSLKCCVKKLAESVDVVACCLQLQLMLMLLLLLLLL